MGHSSELFQQRGVAGALPVVGVVAASAVAEAVVAVAAEAAVVAVVAVGIKVEVFCYAPEITP